MYKDQNFILTFYHINWYISLRFLESWIMDLTQLILNIRSLDDDYHIFFLSLIMRWREIFNTYDKRKRNKKGIKLIEANLLWFQKLSAMVSALLVAFPTFLLQRFNASHTVSIGFGPEIITDVKKKRRKN